MTGVIGSSKFVTLKARISKEFDSKKDSQSKKKKKKKKKKWKN